jgi:CHASE1-domain containing sensor protein
VNEIVFRHSRTIILLIWLLAAGLGVAVFFITKQAVDATTDKNFDSVVSQFAGVANRQFNFNDRLLDLMSALFYMDAVVGPQANSFNATVADPDTFLFPERTLLNTSVTRSAFDTYSSAFIADEPSIRSLNWMPRVATDEARDLWTSISRASYNVSDAVFSITFSNGSLGEVPRGEFPYYPRVYVYPYAGINSRALLRDLRRTPERVEIMQNAALSGKTACSRIFRVINAPYANVPGVFIVKPVFYRRIAGLRASSVDDPLLQGFVMAVLGTTEMMTSTFQLLLERYPMIWVAAIEPEMNEVFYMAGSRNGSVTSNLPPKSRSWWATRSANTTIKFADRDFIIYIKEVEPLTSKSQRNQVFTNLIVTTITVGIVGCFVLVWSFIHQQRQRQLQHSIKTLQDFTAMTTHDLRTPVSAFQLTLHLLKQTQLSSEQRGLLESQEAARMAMQHVIDNVLVCEQYSKGKAEKLRPHESHVDVVGKVEDVVRMTTMYYLDEGHVNVDVRTHFARMVSWGDNSFPPSTSRSLSSNTILHGPQGVLRHGPDNDELARNAVQSMSVHFDERYLQQVS